MANQFTQQSFGQVDPVQANGQPELDKTFGHGTNPVSTPAGLAQSSYISIEACGVCDPTHQDDVLATHWGLYSTGWVRFGINTAAAAPRIITMMSSDLPIFVTGQGATPSANPSATPTAENYPFPLTLAATNILRSGFPATGEAFVATGCTVHIGQAVATCTGAATAVALAAGAVALPSLNLANGVYVQTLVEKIRDNIQIKIVFDQGTRNRRLDLGGLSWFPDYLSGGSEIGYTSMAHNFAMPFVISRPSNSPTEAPKVLLEFMPNQSLLEDTTGTLVADLTAVGAADGVVTNSSFYVPVKVTFLGKRYCSEAVCNTAETAQINDLRAQLAALTNAVANMSGMAAPPAQPASRVVR